MKANESRYLFFLFIAFLLCASNTLPVSQAATENNIRIAIGSCNRQYQSQDFWKAITAEKPDLFLYLGDTIYADTDDMRIKRQAYKKLFSNPDFLRLWKSTRIEAIWDDHDFASNDKAGTEYPQRDASQKTFLDAFQVPLFSPRRKQKGIYQSWIQGPPGKRLQIILLDGRYFKSAILDRPPTAEEKARGVVGHHPPLNDQRATLLGETQWKWLENELQKPAEIRIIASGSQVVANERQTEYWGNFPHERKRLFDLIQKTKAAGVFFISGDAHFSEISKTTEGAYPFYDFTSSSLNQTDPVRFKALNSFRIPGKGYSNPNYGIIQIDWSPADPEIHLVTKSDQGQTAFEQIIHISELQFPKS